MTRTVAIALKIFDNEAYTALTALRRLGITVSGVERAEIWQMEDSGSENDFAARVQRSEALFNPNKHVLTVLHDTQPRAGEAWIEPIGGDERGLRVSGVPKGRRYISWRLIVDGRGADAALVKESADKLLCNPAIERAIVRG